MCPPQDFLTALQQRLEVFDRLDTIKSEIGPDPKAFVAGLTTNLFHSPVPVPVGRVWDSREIQGTGGGAGMGRAAAQTAAAASQYKSVEPLAKMFESIDDACAFLTFHSEFLEVGPACCLLVRA